MVRKIITDKCSVCGLESELKNGVCSFCSMDTEDDTEVKYKSNKSLMRKCRGCGKLAVLKERFLCAECFAKNTGDEGGGSGGGKGNKVVHFSRSGETSKVGSASSMFGNNNQSSSSTSQSNSTSSRSGFKSK